MWKRTIRKAEAFAYAGDVAMAIVDALNLPRAKHWPVLRFVALGALVTKRNIKIYEELSRDDLPEKRRARLEKERRRNLDRLYGFGKMVDSRIEIHEDGPDMIPMLEIDGLGLLNFPDHKVRL